MDRLIVKCEEVAQLLKELAHPQRLQMLCYISHSAKTVSELTKLCGVSQSRVSQFLRQMKADGLVGGKRDGKYVYYRITSPQVEKLIKALRQVCAS